MFEFIRLSMGSQEMSVFSSVKVFVRLEPGLPFSQEDRYSFAILRACEPLNLIYTLLSALQTHSKIMEPSSLLL